MRERRSDLGSSADHSALIRWLETLVPPHQYGEA
jgi:hypothetical protein